MNEEEIIKQVDFITKWISKIGLIKEREAIQGLLDLYNKEKEKNQELQNYMKGYLIPKSTINLLYISKDKIRQLKSEIHQILDKNGITRAYQLIVDKEFKKLLEEE